jgi:hypothetical protein
LLPQKVLQPDTSLPSKEQVNRISGSLSGQSEFQKKPDQEIGPAFLLLSLSCSNATAFSHHLLGS